MFSRIIYNFIVILVLAILQIAFISSLPAGFNNLNLVITILIFVLILANFKKAMIWAISLGFIMDIFSFSFFGIYLITFSLAILGANILLNNYFTNRSLYSFLFLVGFATIIYQTNYNILRYLMSLFSKGSIIVVNSGFWLNSLIQLGLNLLLTWLLFYLLYFISRRFRPAFLLNTRFTRF